MQPEIELGPLTLQSFGLMMGLGFVVAGWLASKRLKEIGHPADWAYEMVFAALVGGLVGARLWSVVENWEDAKDDLLGSLFSGTGLVFYGGALGGALAVALWAWRRGVFGPRMFDVAAPSLAIGYAVGRIGCQLAGDGDYGVACGGVFALWLLLAGGERFLVEFIRRNEAVAAGLTVAQLFSLAMIAGGV